MTPDVNVLVAAFRPGHPQHPVALSWLDSARIAASQGKATLALLPQVAAGFLRLVTSSRVFSDAAEIQSAIAFLDALLSTPGVEMQGAEAWPLFRSKLLHLGLQGNYVSDAWIAASTEALAEHLVTFDRDFKRLLAPRDVTILAAKPVA